MDIEGWDCDGPGCSVETRDPAGAHGWFHLATMQATGRDVPEQNLKGTFHSLDCLLEFVETQADEVDREPIIASITAIHGIPGPQTGQYL